MRVVQSWDDGMVDDVRLTGLLRRYRAKAAFNLNPGLQKVSGRSVGGMATKRCGDWVGMNSKMSTPASRSPIIP